MVTLPEIEVFDIVLGLASAVLFVLALFYIARSKLGPSLTLAQPHSRDDPAPLFQQLAVQETARGLSFIASLFLHMLGIALVPWFGVMFPDALVPQYSLKELVLLEYRIPDIPLVTPGDIEELTKENKEEPEEKPAPKAAPPSRITVESESAAKAKAAAESAPEPALKVASKKQIEVFQQVFKVVLPEIAPSDPALRDVILQPDLALEFPPDYAPRLPPVLAWTPNPRELENAQLVDPGHKVPDTVDRWELPDTEPGLVAPNDQTSLADLQMNPSPVVIEDPALPMPTAAVSPLQGVAPPLEPLPQLPVLSEGDSSTALVALSQEPNPLSPTFLLEMGLRLGTIDNSVDVPPGSADDSSEGTSAAAVEGELASVSDSVVEGGEADGVDAEGADDGSETAETLAAAPNAVGGPDAEGDPSTETAAVAEADDPEADGHALEVAENTAGEGLGSGEAGGPADSQQADASNAGSEDSGTEVASASGGDPSGTDSAEESGTGGGDAKRDLKPLPRRQYGIILVSSGQTNFQDLDGVLKGSPIYTVHIEVPEAPRKWTLQFCIPDSKKRRLDVSSGVIRITPRKKVAPPFPLNKKALHLEEAPDPNLQRPSSVMVYATVDEEGAIGNLKVVRGADPQTDNTILAHLRSWEFLPAFRGEEPILVEALFGIPLP